MPKYVVNAIRYSQAVGDDVQDPHLVVFEDNDAKPTGLLDTNGHQLYRLPDRVKLGFVSNKLA